MSQKEECVKGMYYGKIALNFLDGQVVEYRYLKEIWDENWGHQYLLTPPIWHPNVTRHGVFWAKDITDIENLESSNADFKHPSNILA